MIRLTLTQIYDKNGNLDHDTILDDREVKPEEVTNVLREYAQHPGNSDDKELIVSFGKDGRIKAVLYNGHNE